MQVHRDNLHGCSARVKACPSCQGQRATKTQFVRVNSMRQRLLHHWHLPLFSQRNDQKCKRALMSTHNEAANELSAAVISLISKAANDFALSIHSWAFSAMTELAAGPTRRSDTARQDGRRRHRAAAISQLPTPIAATFHFTRVQLSSAID